MSHRLPKANDSTSTTSEMCVSDLTPQQLAFFRSNRSVSGHKDELVYRTSPPYDISAFTNYKIYESDSSGVSKCEIYFAKELTGDIHFDSQGLIGIEKIINLMVSKDIIVDTPIRMEGISSLDNAYDGVVVNKTSQSSEESVAQLHKDRIVFDLKGQQCVDTAIKTFSTHNLQGRN